jgi:predicted transcriptional regulator
MAKTVEETREGWLIKMTAEVVAAYLSNNTLPATQLGDVIQTVYLALKAQDGGPLEAASEPAKPAVPIRRSITPDYLVCLEDGKRLKMLKRYLRASFGMTPDDYRTKWGLPPDYPMVAPNYAAQRSAFAKQIGLGRGPRRARGRQPRK